jgi:hypothetical protein
MFALWIDLDSNFGDEHKYFPLARDCFVNAGSRHPWAYEPKLDFMDGFACDFQILMVQFALSGRPVIVHGFVEYKPSRPTKTYCERYFKRYKNAMVFCDTTGKMDVSRSSVASIYYGSVFSEDRGRFSLTNNGLISHQDYDWIGDHQREIQEYRFDLAVQHG